MRHIKTIFFSTIVLLFSCSRAELTPPIKPNGKEVIVSLKLSVPKATTIKNGNLSRSSALDNNLHITFDDAPTTTTQTRSDGTTKLYNMWLFQFNADGSINGTPRKISDEVTAINDLVTIEVPLFVAENQTLYLIALGPKISDDLSKIRSLSDISNLEFDYTTSHGGTTESNITADSEIPFAGSVSGVKVLDIDGGNSGLVEYDSPTGFSGNIPIKRLMAHIVLRYKFDVSNYKLQGFKLINVPKTISMKSNSITPSTGAFIDITPHIEGPDADGFGVARWYVPENRQGDVETILLESDRYYKKVGSVIAGSAPPRGSYIEAWANKTSNSDIFAVYQMYVGTNNTSNFDVIANNSYNLRTTINAEIKDTGQKDERIKNETVNHAIYANVSATYDTNTSYFKGEAASKYDFDAHFDRRLLKMTTHGTTVSIGIYEDQACTIPATKETSWLKISSSDNYTDAVLNQSEPLCVSLSTDIFLPTQLRFYLYSDEYIVKSNGEPANTENGMAENRTIYVRVETKAIGATGGALKSKVTCEFRQRPAHYAGVYGGEFDGSGYTQGLMADWIAEYDILYDNESFKQEFPVPPFAFSGIVFPTMDYFLNKAIDIDHGRDATRALSENKSNFNISAGLTYKIEPTRRLSNGFIDLYQYNNYNTYAARFCYDRNRDEDGSGVIENDELKWYLPSVRQLLGYATTTKNFSLHTEGNRQYLTADITAEDSNDNSSNVSLGTTTLIGQVNNYIRTHQKNNFSIRCVRNITDKDYVAKKTKKVSVYTSEKGEKYAMINNDDLPRNTIDRLTESEFYKKDMVLHNYTPTGEEADTVRDKEGKDVMTQRIQRHIVGTFASQYDIYPFKCASNVSLHFIISPNDLPDDTTSKNFTMDWATANGYLATANTTEYNVGGLATNKGCYMYQGKNNEDPIGTWRLPTTREALLILTFYPLIEATSDETGYQSMLGWNKLYWTATEYLAENSMAMGINNPVTNTKKIKISNSSKKIKLHLRCIKDIAPKK